MALYWLTGYGFSDAAAEVHWSHQFLIGRNRQLVDQLAQVRTVNRVLCGLFDDRLRAPVLHIPDFAGTDDLFVPGGNR